MRPLFLILQYLEVSLLAYIRVCRLENTLIVLAEGRDHKVHTYSYMPGVPECLSPLLNWDPPTPSPASWLMMHRHFHDARMVREHF